MFSNKSLAAIDIGTNSFHLVIANVNSRGQLKVLTREKEVVRLGSGSDDMKYISGDAISRGVSALKRFKLICDSYNAEIRAVGTSAVREALNKETFINSVRENTGIDIEIVTGTEEARLIYLGVLQALEVYNNKILMIDIGGGSTEFLVGEKGDAKFVNSIKLGAVRLTQKFFSDKKLKQSLVNDARMYVKSMVYPVVRKLKYYDYNMVIGTSGTIVTLGAIIYAEKNDYDREQVLLNNFTYTNESLLKTVKKILKAETDNERARIKGIDLERADIITAGAIILEQLFLELGIKQITISNFALREGILIDAVTKKQIGFQLGNLSDVCYNSIITLAENCKYDKGHSEQVLKLSISLFGYLKHKFKLTDKDKEYLEAAALLHDIGHSISHTQHHRHSYYLIRNSEMLGFNENEIEIIANTARYHRKSHPKPKHEEFNKLNKNDKDRIRKLSGILRIADGLDRGHKSIIEDLKFRQKGKNLFILLKTKPETDVTLEIWGANLRKKLFEEAFGFEITFEQIL